MSDFQYEQMCAKYEWVRKIPDPVIRAGIYSRETVFQGFWIDFYHDVYHSRIYNTIYVAQDLEAMIRFEKISPQLYKGLYILIAREVLKRAVEHPLYNEVVQLVTQYQRDVDHPDIVNDLPSMDFYRWIDPLTDPSPLDVSPPPPYQEVA